LSQVAAFDDDPDWGYDFERMAIGEMEIIKMTNADLVQDMADFHGRQADRHDELAKLWKTRGDGEISAQHNETAKDHRAFAEKCSRCAEAMKASEIEFGKSLRPDGIGGIAAAGFGINAKVTAVPRNGAPAMEDLEKAALVPARFQHLISNLEG
jgi:hypothetical protein